MIAIVLHGWETGLNTLALQEKNIIIIARQKCHSGKSLVSGLKERGEGVVQLEQKVVAVEAVTVERENEVTEVTQGKAEVTAAPVDHVSKERVYFPLQIY